MQKIYFLFYILITQVCNLQAITIEVIAPNYKNKDIKWEKRTDYISNEFSIIDQSTIDSSGKAILKGDFKQIELTEISIGRSHGFIYIDTATKNYKVYFPKDTLLEIASLKKSRIQLLFINLPSDDINQLLLDFNLYYDYFLYGDTNKIVRMAKHDEEFQDSLNNFKIFSSKRYGPIKIKYLHNYIRYEIALLEQMAHQSKGDIYRSYLYNTYLKRNGINYNNDAYMQFFNLFYFKPFRIGGDELYERVLFTVNELNDYDKLNSVLASNQYFSNNQLRELAIIKGLFDGINSKAFSTKFIINLLAHIESNSKWDQHQLIAQRCINELLKFKVGEQSPDFDLTNQEGKSINLSSCKKKYTYINFFATWNHRSLQEMEIINQMSMKYDFINFISINMDKNIEIYKSYLKENEEFNWEICSASNQEELINNFNLDHLPTYLLLDPSGDIAQYPAYPPSPLYNSQSIDITFFNLKKNNTIKTPFGIGGKN